MEQIMRRHFLFSSLPFFIEPYQWIRFDFFYPPSLISSLNGLYFFASFPFFLPFRKKNVANSCKIVKLTLHLQKQTG